MNRRDFIILLAFLLLGAALRFQGQAEMSSILHHDEAAYGVDALSLLANPRLQVYFPANTGREGLWVYLLTPLVGTLGAHPLALRLSSAFIGILSLAAVYLLARETYKQGAFWAVGVLAVLYWHLHLSHLGFRVISFPLMGALAFATILRAYRLNRSWWLAGLLLALLLYTYVAAQVYVAYGALWLIFWAISDKSRRKGALIALGIAIMLILPLIIAMLQPSETSLSVTRAAASGLDEIWQNLVDWAGAWLIKGDRTSTHNLPHRPVLDLPLAILAGLGFIGAWFTIRKKWLIIWWFGLVLVGLLPTVLSTEAPHFLRGSGLILPLVLLLGLGAAFIANLPKLVALTELQHLSEGFYSPLPRLRGKGAGGLGVNSENLSWLTLVPLTLILWAGWNSYSDFQRWLIEETAEFGISYDYRLNAGMEIIAEQTSSDSPIVMAGIVSHPNAVFLAAGMQRPIYFYEWSDDTACYLSPRQTYAALDLPIILDSFARRAAPYTSHLETIFAHPQNEENIYLVEPLPELIEAWDTPILGNTLQMHVLSTTASTAQAGENLQINLAMRLTGALPRADYRILAHLQGEPNPYEGGALYSTGDTPLCSLLYAGILDELTTAVQQITLPIPTDLAAGDYHIALGLYEPDTFTRLPISPAENEHDYFVGWHFRVVE